MAFLHDSNSPDQQAAQDVREQGLLGAVATTAMSFIGYGIGLKVARSVSFKANIGIGRLITKLTRPAKNVTRRIDSAYSDLVKRATTQSQIDNLRSGRQFLNKLRTDARRSIGKIEDSLQGAIHPLQEEGRYFSSVVRKEIATSERSLGRGKVRGKAYDYLYNKNNQLKDIRATSIIANTERFANSFLGRMIHKGSSISKQYGGPASSNIVQALMKAPAQDMGKVITGRLYRYATGLASYAAFDYGMYNMTQPSDKKWYNPTKMAEWAAFTVGTDLAFKGAIFNAKLIGSKISQGSASFMRSQMGKNLTHSVLSRAERIANSVPIRAGFGAIDNIAAKHGEGSSTGIDFMQKIKAFGKEYSKIKLNLSKTKRAIDNPDAYDDALDHLAALHKNNADGMSEKLQANIRDEFSANRKDNDPNKWTSTINRLFGTDLQSAKRTAVTPDKAATEIFRGAGRVSLDGKQYNITNVLPSRVLEGAFNLVHDNFKILGFPVFSVLGIRPHLSGAAKRFALYSGESHHGMLHIGPGYNKRAIDAKLNRLGMEQDTIANKYFNADNPALKEHETLMEEILAGRVGTVEEREVIRKIRGEQKDLTNAKNFVDSYLLPRTMTNAENISKTEQQLEMGYVRLKKGEFVQFVGNKAYFGTRREGTNFDVFQLGYDTNKGEFHQLTNVAGEHAGSLISLMNQARGYDPETGLKSVKPISKSRVNPDAGPLNKMLWGMMDTLEIGNKQERSIFGLAKDYVTKLFHPKTFRNIVDGYTSNPNYVENVNNENTLHFLVGRLQTSLREADVYLTDKVIKKSSFIEQIASHARKHVSEQDMLPGAPAATGLDHVKDDLRAGKLFFTGAMNVEASQMDSHTRSVARRLKSAMIDTLSKDSSLDEVQYRLASKNIAFLSEMETSTDPVKFLGQAYSPKVKNKDYFNNLAFRTYFNSIEQGRQQELISGLTALTSSSAMKKDIELLSLSRMINTFDTINVDRLDQAQMHILGNAFGSEVSKNPNLFRQLAENLEPLHRPSNIHDNINYANTQFRPANIVLSQNKSATGESIYSLGDQLLGSYKTVTGEKMDITHTGMSMMMRQALNAINNTATPIGMGFNPDAMQSVGTFATRVLFKRILPAMALGATYKASDAFFDESGLFEGTVLGEGLSVLGANMIAQSRLAMAGVSDAIGLTAMSKYLEDIMPGFVNSPLAHGVRGVGSPLLGLNLGMKYGGPKGALIGGSIGAAVSLLTSGGPLGMLGKFDITKSREDLIEEYSGRRQVPHYKGAGWLLGSGPIAGTTVERFEPSWFHKIQSQYKHTDVLYGSKIERLLAPFDMDHYYEKHKLTRPYPISERAFSDVPLIGPMIALGGSVADEQELKTAVYANALSGGGINISGALAQPQMGIVGPNFPMIPGSSTTNPMGPIYSQEFGPGGMPAQQYAVLPGSSIGRMNAGFQQMTDFFGLRGFLSETVFERFNQGLLPYEDVPQLESASWMTSNARAYWDADLGDMAGMNEFVRRFIPKHGQRTNDINPLPNTMPSWISSVDGLKDFSVGDIFTKVKDGEARLPGAGYEAMHSVKFDFPLEAEYMGRSWESTVAMLTGNYLPTTQDEKYQHILGGKIAQRVQEEMAMSNAMVAAGTTLFDPRSNMSGRIDMVINGVPTKTKVVSDDTFKRLGFGAQEHHESEMNTLLMMGAGPVGSIIYFNAETGETKNIKVKADQTKYYRDMGAVMEAKNTALKLVNQNGPNIGINMANAYSRVDRLAILQDVAPYSDQYQDTLRQVRTLSKMGKLSAEDQVQIDTIEKQREQVIQRYKTTEYKFHRGTAATPEERQQQSLIGETYNPIERTLGGLWEGFAHMDTVIHNKFLNVVSAREAYERYELYGKQIRNWSTPYESFIRPYSTSLLAKDDPITGGMSFGTGGFIFGGPAGAAIGATVGTVYGAVNSAFGFGQIPGYRQEERNLTSQLDRIRFEKAKNIFETTGALDAKEEMMRTMTYQYNNAATVRSMFSAVPRHERAYIRQFAKEGSLEERARIMEIMPDYVQPLLEKTWEGNAWDTKSDPRLGFVSEDKIPSPEWKGWNSNIATDDIAYKAMERAGLDSHDISLGWQEQVRNLKYKSGIPDSFTDNQVSSPTTSVRSIVKSIVANAIVSIQPTPGEGIQLNVN